MSSYCGRFAPSATGPAHPGTLLAALICWLDARSQSGRVILRFEDLDPQRCSPQKTQALRDHLVWFGLDEWDAIEVQSEQVHRHHQAIQRLRDQLYPCSCSRAEIKRSAQQAIDGGWIYPGTCRHKGSLSIPQARIALRLPLDQHIAHKDRSGKDLSQNIPEAMGDPVILRRDGAVSYLLASVVDDAAQGVSHVVRGEDLMHASASQLAIGDLLGFARPAHWHHLLLLEPQGNKLAKFHGSVGVPELKKVYSPQQLCGILAHAAGLIDTPDPCRPADLLGDYAWDKVSTSNVTMTWNGSALIW